MQVQFKGPRVIDGQKYPKGINHVPNELEDHWYFKHLVSDGDAVIIDSEKSESIKAKPKKKLEVKPDLKALAPKKETIETKIFDEKVK